MTARMTTEENELDKLNSLHTSYLNQLSQQFYQQFPNAADQGRQYWEEFLGFVRLQILPSSGWCNSVIYKPPFEVVSQFKEWKIAELEKRIAHIESTSMTPQNANTVSTCESPQNESASHNGDSNGTKTSSGQKETSLIKPELHTRPEKEAGNLRDNYELQYFRIEESAGGCGVVFLGRLVL